MKNQYFGDINDYRKYGLLRAIIGAGNFRLLVAWLLTPDDGSTDGKFVSYLLKPKKWSLHDPVLFQGIKNLFSTGKLREVNLIEDSDLLPETQYFSDYVPDEGEARSSWFDSLLQRAKDCDFVFLDPDNGLEVKSRRYGTKNSSKFLYWREVESLWNSGKSLLIYQHFIREKRDHFIDRMMNSIQNACPDSTVATFATSNVLFLMALQPAHKSALPLIRSTVEKNWAGQICCCSKDRPLQYVYGIGVGP